LARLKYNSAAKPAGLLLMVKTSQSSTINLSFVSVMDIHLIDMESFRSGQLYRLADSVEATARQPYRFSLVDTTLIHFHFAPVCNKSSILYLSY
jgi:hypothetical protein